MRHLKVMEFENGNLKSETVYKTRDVLYKNELIEYLNKTIYNLYGNENQNSDWELKIGSRKSIKVQDLMC